MSPERNLPRQPLTPKDRLKIVGKNLKERAVGTAARLFVAGSLVFTPSSARLPDHDEFFSTPEVSAAVILKARPFTGGYNAYGVEQSIERYFPEGYTAKEFYEYLDILNPNTQTAKVVITYYLSGGVEPIIRQFDVLPQTIVTADVHQWSAGVGREQEVSAKVVSANGVGIVSERRMEFAYNLDIIEAHTSLGAAAPHPTWYFAEGYTGEGFDEYLTIMNPQSQPAEIELTYYLASGAPVQKIVSVPANSRYTVVVHETKEGVGRGQAVSAKVHSRNGVGVVVERPMYFKYNTGQMKADGGHNVVGTNSPAPLWYFAEGYTGEGFDEYLTIMNPNNNNTKLKVTYFLSGGQSPVVKEVDVAANSRFTIAVHDQELGVGRGQAVSAKVETIDGAGIVVERPMYFNYKGQIPGGHNVMGETKLKKDWAFASGSTIPNDETYLTILNPNDTPEQTTITYYGKEGVPTETRQIIAEPNSRTTIPVNDGSKGGITGQRQVGSRIQVTSNNGVVSERPTYTRQGNDTNVQMVRGIGEKWISTKELMLYCTLPEMPDRGSAVLTPIINRKYAVMAPATNIEGQTAILRGSYASSDRGPAIIGLIAEYTVNGVPRRYIETHQTEIIN